MSYDKQAKSVIAPSILLFRNNATLGFLEFTE